jgi:hypothetical protein
MRAVSFSPGLTYYVMAVLALLAISNVFLAAFDVLPYDGHERGIAYFGGVLGFFGLLGLAVAWHRFTPLAEGLHVTDLRGRRLHRWEDLGRPVTREFAHGGEPIFTRHGLQGVTETQAFTHYIRDVRGRTLYRVGPWFPGRRELMREIRRRTREVRD